MPNPDAIAQERREECRRETLRFLAERQAVAHHPKTVRRRLNDGHEHDFTDADVQAALVFLVSASLAREIPDALGATRHYQATAAGVLAHERGATFAP
ncbi:hypothetical protein [Horticoccus sp. 23ND18S-11]|uniref:hypothetical protein n=1 Tax=Horticoccus sp. 23ND18S-11 TaxID=3391832 RepID=UPI0039C95F4F